MRSELCKWKEYEPHRPDQWWRATLEGKTKQGCEGNRSEEPCF